MSEVITKAEVMRHTGLGKTVVQMAIQRGELRAHRGELPPPGRGVGYLIYRADMEAWVASRERPDRLPWIDADLAALVELSTTCSDAQIAEYLDRSVRSVSQRLFKLRQTEGMDLRARRGYVACFPWAVPGDMPLLARTCVRCGNLRDATYFARLPQPGGSRCWSTTCYLCLRQKASANRKPQDRTVDRRLQEATACTAHHHRQPYVSADYEVLADRDKSDLQVAMELGRTFIAVRHKRTEMGFYNGPKRKDLPDTHWLIHFPNALKALQEHYRELGVVPESEWDWNDRTVSA